MILKHSCSILHYQKGFNLILFSYLLQGFGEDLHVDLGSIREREAEEIPLFPVLRSASGVSCGRGSTNGPGGGAWCCGIESWVTWLLIEGSDARACLLRASRHSHHGPRGLTWFGAVLRRVRSTSGRLAGVFPTFLLLRNMFLQRPDSGSMPPSFATLLVARDSVRCLASHDYIWHCRLRPFGASNPAMLHMENVARVAVALSVRGSAKRNSVPFRMCGLRDARPLHGLRNRVNRPP